MDDDLAEMAALRKASRFQSHERQYGSRSQVKHVRERAEAKREQEAEQARSLREESARARDGEVSSDDSDDSSDEEAAKRQKKRAKTNHTSKKQSSEAIPEEDGEDEEEEDAETKALRAMLPGGFGSRVHEGRAKAVNTAEVHAKLARKPTTDAATDAGANSDSEDSDAGLTEEQRNQKDQDRKDAKAQRKRERKEKKRQEKAAAAAEANEAAELHKNDPYKLPISHEVELKRHKKTVLTIGVEPSGARVLTGSADYNLKFWDFGGMNQDLRSFRKCEPEEAHPVMSISHNPTGSLFLCVTGSSRPKIFDRDGFEQSQFIRGDMYLHDMKYTKGHVTSVCQGQWHPNDKEKVITSSVDGTVRIWSIQQTQQCLETIKMKVNQHKRVTVSACCYSPDGNLIAGADNNGSLQVWQAAAKKKLIPHKYHKRAHQVGQDATSLCFNQDGTKLLSRSQDHTMKLWDLRKFVSPVKVWEDLPNIFPNTTVMFSPDQKTILCSVSGEKLTDKGSLRFYDSTTLEQVRQVDTDAACVSLKWHPSLNQIFMGCSDGITRILYSPSYSQKGVMLCAGKRAPRKDATSSLKFYDIKTPNALPMFRDTNQRHERSQIKHNPLKTKKPEPPPEASKGGRLAGPSLTMHIIQNIHTKQIAQKNLDPRDELLKYADKAADDPMWFGRAYAKTQPVPMYAEQKEDDEDDQNDEIIKRISNRRQAKAEILTPQAGVPEEKKKAVALKLLEKEKGGPNF
eukprot:CAMPEP_0175096592 /NCGR_PEP_ID=MMETSP0086_2-20121207/4815_1 /TAXON_ID=136419 /ORGANISM="Unknown Unknown, Strain D1" /LENGTH=740 /DNA_ID=CAMNT_0016370005 /DNA_START=32 /DNA_END=2254 /DNA_ORIENTATION=-